MSPLARLTQRDFALAAALGVLLAMSPLSGPKLGLSLAIGSAGAAGFLLFRVFFSPAAPKTTRDAAESAQRDAAAEPSLPLPAGLALVLALAVFAPTLQWLYTNWTMSIWVNTHGLFIPPIMALMIHDILRRDRRRRAEASAWGFAFLIPGLAIAVLDAVMGTFYFSVLGLVLALPGLSLLLLGPRRTRRIAFPLLLGIFMVPIPASFNTTLYLREITAIGTEALLQLQGYTVIRTDTVLEMAWGNVSVAQACSGLSTLYSSITVASILVYYSRTPRRKLIIALLTLPMALGANVIRALALVMMSQQWGTDILDTQLHEGSGVATFAVVLVTLYLISDMPKRARRRPA